MAGLFAGSINRDHLHGGQQEHRWSMYSRRLMDILKDQNAIVTAQPGRLEGLEFRAEVPQMRDESVQCCHRNFLDRHKPALKSVQFCSAPSTHA